jgi:hypothetical protein
VIAGVITAVLLIKNTKVEINPLAIVLTSLTPGGNSTLSASYVQLPQPILTESLLFSATVPLTGTLYFFYPSSITLLSASQGTVTACGTCPPKPFFTSAQIAVSLSTNQKLKLTFSNIISQCYYLYI